MTAAARFATAVTAVSLVGCAPPAAVGEPMPALPRTRAELSGYSKTSTYADVRVFLDSLRALRAPLAAGVMGRTAGGREIPYVIASRPLVRTPGQARALWPRRPIVYVQGNIHGGEVEGKEALLMLLRNLALQQRPNALDSIVLIAVPIYNVDGNEELGPQEANRPEQNGPAMIGRRPNAAGLDLNRDYIKAEAPETRASLGLFTVWNPDVFVDLHTTNGSLHGYALTYSPPLNPAAPLEHAARDWLSTLRARMRARHQLETFDYGNFGTDETPWQSRQVYTPDVHAWTTFDHRPRFSTNYYGLRGGIGILAEAYSHDPFERRVAATYAFVSEILSLAAESGAHVIELRAQAAIETSGQLPIRSRITASPQVLPVLVEDVELTGDSARTEIGLAPGVRRSGRFSSVPMPVYDRFETVGRVPTPVSYLYPSKLRALTDMLALHGIPAQPLRESAPADVEEFLVDSVVHATRSFEGHRETKVFGRWVPAQAQSGSDYHIAPAIGSRAPLVAYLLDPESDDGLVTWNFLDGQIRPGEAFPVRRARPVRAGR